MAGHTFFGKQKLCYTEVSDFTDYQGIGHDPMYRRFDSVFSVVRRAIPSNLQHFLATPEYLDDEDQICWYVDNWNEHPSRLTELTGIEREKYKSILEDTVRKYKSAIIKLNGEDLQIMAGAIKYIDDDRVYCGDDKVYLVAWGMTLDKHQHKVVGSVIHDFEYVKKYKISFYSGEHGSISKLDKSMNRAEGTALTNKDLPTVNVDEGWDFVGWYPNPIGLVVSSDMTFAAQYKKTEVPSQSSSSIEALEPAEPSKAEYFNCRFDAGEHGKIIGVSNVRKEVNSTLLHGEVPDVTPNKGYKFKGWNISPYNMLIDEDKVFIAQYEKSLPWYRRWWHWLAALFAGKGCLKWLLWMLLAILLLWLLSWLLRGCVGCTGHHAPVTGVLPTETIIHSDGEVVEDGIAHPITGNGSVVLDRDSYVTSVHETVIPVPNDSNGGISAREEVIIEETPVLSEPLKPGDEADYDAIRRKIAEYKQKISELEKLLPNNR